jgi:surface carbohydrate biosynthesis protein
MEQNSKEVMLPIEIKRRELTGKILLSLRLAKRGHSIFLGSMDQYTAIDQIKPDVCFDLSAVNREGRRSRLRRLKQCGVTTIILDTEGSAFGELDNFRPRVSNEILRYTDFYCAWGSKSADIALDEKKDSDTKVRITGNPRFDLLQEPIRQVYFSEAENIYKKYGDYILFNTNFSINHVDIDHNKQFALTDPTKKYKKQSILIGEFISAIGVLSRELTDHSIVVRPHPSEDSSLYQRLLNPYENVFVEKKGEVRPWIMASDAVIHNSCTTGVTSALLGTPVFAYIPQDITLSSIPNEVSRKCYTLSELTEEVTAAANSTTNYTMDEEQESELRAYIDNVNHLSAERIADVIDSIDQQQPDRFNQHFKPRIKNQIKRQIVKITGSDRFESIYYERLRGGGSTSYKFSKTTVDEIESLVSCFPSFLVPDNLKISTVPGVMYTFKFEVEN